MSVDLVNTVLKDSNVPPILGANDSQWDRIEYDRSYYFPSDEIVDLSTEYSKDIIADDCGDVRLYTMWMSSLESPGPLKNFAEKLCNGIFNGLTDCVDYALEITENDPNIGCIVKLLLHSCCEQLMKDYSSDLLKRVIKFISAMTFNPYTRDGNIDGNLIVLAQLLLCVILGPNKINIPKMNERKRIKTEYRLNASLQNSKDYDSDTSGESVLSDPPFDFDDEPEIFETTKTEILQTSDDQLLSSFKLEETNIATDNLLNISSIYTNGDESTGGTTTIIEEQLDNGVIDQNRTLSDIKAEGIVNYKNEYEELFAIMEELRSTNQLVGGNDGIVNFENSEMKNEKIEFTEDGQIININTDDMELEVTNIKKELLEGPPALIENQMKIDFDEQQQQQHIEMKPTKRNSSCMEEKCSKVFTKMCKRKMISDVAMLIGITSAHWGYFEKIATLILKNRLEEYFADEKIWTQRQYDWIVRVVYASWALGEEAIRNFFNFLDKLSSSDFPEWTNCHVVVKLDLILLK